MMNWWSKLNLKYKLAIYAILCAIFILSYLLVYRKGFINGVSSVKIDNKIEYIPIAPISGLNILPEPIKVDLPTVPYFIIDTLRKDSIIRIPLEVDSAKILKDYLIKRYYSEQLYDIDSIGKCNVTAEVQYNRLLNLKYEVFPIEKVITKDKLQTIKLSVFGGAGFNTSNAGRIQLGAFKGNLGFSYGFNKSFSGNDNYHDITLLYKFDIK